MLVLRQSRYDALLLTVVILLSIAANLPDEYAFVDKNLLIAMLVVILCITLVRYVRASLVVVTAVLVFGAKRATPRSASPGTRVFRRSWPS